MNTFLKGGHSSSPSPPEFSGCEFSPLKMLAVFSLYRNVRLVLEASQKRIVPSSWLKKIENHLNLCKEEENLNAISLKLEPKTEKGKKF